MQRHRFDDKLRSSDPNTPSMRAPLPPQPQQGQVASVPVTTAEVDTDFPDSPLPNPSPHSSSVAVGHAMDFLQMRNAAWKFPTSLVFAPPPMKDSPNFTPRTGEELRYPNSTFPLSLRDQESSQVIGYECFLNESLQVLELHVVHDDGPLATRIAESINTILDTLATLETSKGIEWDRQVRAEKSPDTYVLTGTRTSPSLVPVLSARLDRFFSRQKSGLAPVVRASIVLILVLRYIFNLSRRKTTVVLAGVRDILRLAGVSADQLGEVPRDPRTALKRFNLDPVFRTYTICSDCYALYPISGTPMDCTFRPTPGDSPCGQHLLCSRERGHANAGDVGGEDSASNTEDEDDGEDIVVDGYYVPIKTYTHQSLTHWLGSMLCRSGIEDEIDNYDRLFAEKDKLEDIWDTSYLRNFPDTVNSCPGYDPELPTNCSGRFFTRRMGEAEYGRYAFTFSADSFNPSGNLAAKMSVSATGMYMVLLNLPPHLRHKTENIYFAGIIPGPGKPSNNQINHFVQLVADELGPLYAQEGVSFSRTAKYPNGRTCRGILVALVADALAARQLGGFGSVTSYHLCTLCKITRNDLENVQGPWVARGLGDHHADAVAWKNAESTKARNDLEKSNLVRWSPFLMLPYWNPILSTAIDSMHNLYLGLIKDHCRVIWGISTLSPGGDGELMPKTIHQRPTRQVMLHWVQIILNASDESSLREILCKRTVPIPFLWYICYDNGLRRDGDQYKLARRIASWACVFCFSTIVA